MEDSNNVEFETVPDEYSARSFYEHYKDNLPQMVMVTQGYMGEGIFETFDRGQVFRIQTYTKQKRVIALVVSGEKGMYGLQGRQISIPADYDVKFHVLKLGKFKVGKPASLKEILERKELPLDVQFAGDEKVLIGSTARTASFTLTLVNTYEDFYLLGNAICDGKLYDSVTAVPAYLPDLRFSIVKSIKGYSDDQYKNFMSVTDQFVKEHITFDQSFGNTEIALYSNERSQQVESSIVESYAYISPCEYYNIGDLLRHDKPKPATKKGKKGNEKVYDVLRVSKYDNQTYASVGVEQTDTGSQSMSGKKNEDSILTNRIPYTDEKGIANKDKDNTQSETVKKDPPPIPPKPPQPTTGQSSNITAKTDTVLSPAIDNKTYMCTSQTEEKVDIKADNIISVDTGTLPATVDTKEPVPQTKEQPKRREQEEEMIDVEFETAKEDYSARSFYEHYKDNLPQMVMVTQGYMGEGIFETFDRGQVFRIQTYSTQKRVVAVVVSGEKGMYGLQGRKISIPANYDVTFHIMKHGKPKGKSIRLKEILEQKELPIEVQISAHEDQYADQQHLGPLLRTGLFTLKLLNTYDDFFLLGNAICDGNLYGSVTAVPAYLPDLQFSIVKSIKGCTIEQYLHFLSVTDQFVKDNITFDQTFGNTDIALYSPEQAHAEESYSYISPCEYYNIGDLLRNNKAEPVVKREKQTDKVYEVIRASTISMNQQENQYEVTIFGKKTGTSNNPQFDSNTIKDAKKQLRNTGRFELARTDQNTGTGKIDELNVGNTLLSSETNDTLKQTDVSVKQEKVSLEKTSITENTDSFSDLTRRLKPTSSQNASDVPPRIPERRSIVDKIGLVRPSPSSKSATTPVQMSQTSESEIIVDVASLTIEDVGEWLRKLKLEKYSDVFEENQVDGCILMSIDEDMLKEDFHMSRFEVMKLMKFVRTGYVPRTRTTES
ncbi:uncharacterized protein LOC127723139 isoform X2 [Mytilus californianus]|nr:uncharacterized protein LOC127723139 isoform X2 [Mytilus californianus]